MEHIAQGKRSDTLGLPHSRVSAPCKVKSFNPLLGYSYLIADLAVLKWNIVCIFCSIPAPCLKAFALSGRDCSNTWYPGCRFACPGLWAPLGFQPAFAKSETWVNYICASVGVRRCNFQSCGVEKAVARGRKMCCSVCYYGLPLLSLLARMAALADACAQYGWCACCAFNLPNAVCRYSVDKLRVCLHS